MKIIVTAFEPFGGSACNSSLATLEALPCSIGECEIVKLTLPVVFGKCADILRDKVAEISPDAVVCLGQAEGRGMITPEFSALNVRHAQSPDNAGQTFELAPIIDGAPEAYFATLPVRGIVKRLQEADIRAQISFTAGTYVCNDLMYQAVHCCTPLGIPAGFIHLPLSYEIAERENKIGRVSTLPQSVLTEGVRLAVETIIKEAL